MDIGLIFSIAAGVVLGGLIIIYRAKIVGKGKEAAELAAEGAKSTGRGIYAIRGWLIFIVVVSAIVIFFVVTRVEKNFEQWTANYALWAETKTACEEKGGLFKLEREYFFCESLILKEADRWSWLYDKRDCKMTYFSGGKRTGEEYVDACAEVAFSPYRWQQILKERERKAENRQP